MLSTPFGSLVIDSLSLRKANLSVSFVGAHVVGAGCKFRKEKYHIKVYRINCTQEGIEKLHCARRQTLLKYSGIAKCKNAVKFMKK